MFDIDAGLMKVIPLSSIQYLFKQRPFCSIQLLLSQQIVHQSSFHLTNASVINPASIKPTFSLPSQYLAIMPCMNPTSIFQLFSVIDALFQSPYTCDRIPCIDSGSISDKHGKFALSFTWKEFV